MFEDVTGRDLSQFKRWYSQAGTPRLQVQEDWRDGTYTLTFSQSTTPSADQPGSAAAGHPDLCGPAGPEWRRGGSEPGCWR